MKLRPLANRLGIPLAARIDRIIRLNPRLAALDAHWRTRAALAMGHLPHAQAALPTVDTMARPAGDWQRTPMNQGRSARHYGHTVFTKPAPSWAPTLGPFSYALGGFIAAIALWAMIGGAA